MTGLRQETDTVLTMADNALADSYRGFDGRLAFGARPALLLIDMVAAYLDPESPLYAGPSAAAALTVATALAAAARAAGVPVILTNVVFRADGRDGGLFYRKLPLLSAFIEGAPGSAFPPDLGPAPSDIVVTKNYASAFFGTSLAATLTAMRVDSLLIGGFSTSGCVRASTVDALQHGFIPYVVRDACADRRAEPHDANLFDLAAKYAEVVDGQAALGLIAAAGR